MLRIYMPHQNLQCFGISLHNPWNGQQWLYADLQRDLRLYVNTGIRRTIGFWFVRRWR